MSDTPRTDNACGWPFGQHGLIESTILSKNAAGPFVHASVARELERENAALRADKERLDWLNIHMECHCHDEDGFHSWLWVKAPATNKDLRAAIDAARKEGQP